MERSVNVRMPEPRPNSADTFIDFAKGVPLKDWSFSDATIDSEGLVRGVLKNPAKGIGHFDAPEGFIEASYDIDFSFNPSLRRFTDTRLTVRAEGSGPKVTFEGPEVRILMYELLNRCRQYLQGWEPVFRTMPDALRESMELPKPPGPLRTLVARLGNAIRNLFDRD